MNKIFALMIFCAFAMTSGAQTNLMSQVGFDQKLATQVPLNLTFRDETGRAVELKEFFGKQPVVLTLVYYDCPMLCNVVMNGVERTVKAMSLRPSRDFQILNVSIDPNDSPQRASRKKRNFLVHSGGANEADGWHCLTGETNSIAQLADAVGFRYKYDPATKQYAHAAGFIVLTPSGKISRYFFGIDFSPGELQDALKTAASEKQGKIVHQLLLLCFHYDPATGKYSITILKTLRVFGVITLVALVGPVCFWLRKERKTIPQTRENTLANSE